MIINYHRVLDPIPNIHRLHRRKITVTGEDSPLGSLSQSLYQRGGLPPCIHFSHPGYLSLQFLGDPLSVSMYLGRGGGRPLRGA